MAIKTIFVTGIFVALTGLPFRATLAAQAAPPQRGESQLEKEMQDRAVREANKKRQQNRGGKRHMVLSLICHGFSFYLIYLTSAAHVSPSSGAETVN